MNQFLGRALPLWFSAGIDPAQQVFVEALSFGGDGLTTLPRRARVQARQLIVMGLAWTRGQSGLDPAALDTAAHARQMVRIFGAVRRQYGAASGGFVAEVDHLGQVTRPERTLYDQAFFLMALAWLYRVTGDPGYGLEAEGVWAFIETLRDPIHGGYANNDQARSGARQQNPHMHLFEACLLCAEHLGAAPWQARADELYRLFSRHFFRTEGPGYLAEFFTPDWRPDPLLGTHIDPGHHFEWTWLLERYQRLTGHPVPEAAALYRTGLAWGTDANGLAYDEVRVGGTELRPTKRLWVQAEALKGHLAWHRLSDDPQASNRAWAVSEAVLTRYLLPGGTYFDQLSPGGLNISPNAPASTLYHLYLALDDLLSVPLVSAPLVPSVASFSL